MTVGRGERIWESSAIEKSGELFKIYFADSGVEVAARILVCGKYFTMEIMAVTGEPVDWLQLSNLNPAVSQNTGKIINAAWDDKFAACVLACNDLVDCGSHGILSARAYCEFGFERAKIAVIGVPAGGSPVDSLLDTIESVEIEQGLPHIKRNGIWIKRNPERLASYLMVSSTLTEDNVDQVIEFARGGFGTIEIYPFSSTPSYVINRQSYPNGLEGLKKVADKIHAAGLKVGLHIFQGMHWGPDIDPYLTPVADSRFIQDRHATLSANLTPQATEININEVNSDWPGQGHLYVEGEIISYTRLADKGFAGCVRGVNATRITSHAQGARLGYLVNSFPFWGGYFYAPDIKSTLFDEIRDKIIGIFDETQADMSYFDDGEVWRKQPPLWRNEGRLALEVQQKLKKPIVLSGCIIYTHLAWHVISCGHPTFDPVFYGRREYTLRYKGQNPAKWAKNLLTGDVGWFAPCTSSPFTDAVTPDEIMLLCLKALGGKSHISIQMNAENLWGNKRMPEMLEIIRACDELKRHDYFSESACAELSKPMAEHILEQDADGAWNIRPMQWGPPLIITGESSSPAVHSPGKEAARKTFLYHKVNSRWIYSNPYGKQRPWMRIRARTRLAPYGSGKNMVLADFNGSMPFKPDGSSSPQLCQMIENSSEKTPDGSSAFRYRAVNKSPTISDWCRISLPFSKPVNLEHHRRLGVWVYSGGGGGILNIQLKNGYGYRDHYITLDFTGWSYFELDPPEAERFYAYHWPYSFTDLFAWHFQYVRVDAINLYYNALPADSEAVCLIGRIEALREYPLELTNPTLATDNHSITFPVSIKPDEYLEMDGHGVCRHFEPDGGLLSEIKTAGDFGLSTGENLIRFLCAINERSAPRAEITFAVRGDPLRNVRKQTENLLNSKPGAGTYTGGNRYPSLCTVPLAAREDIKTLPNGMDGIRIMQGVYERVCNRYITLPEIWDFKKDPDDTGLNEMWFEKPVDSSWGNISVTSDWTVQGHDYHGVAWYHVKCQIPVEYQGTKPVIQFGAVDGSADIFLDGVKIGGQKKNVAIMWDQPFKVPLPDHLDFTGAHNLMVRVKKDICAAGIWKPVTIRPLVWGLKS